MEHDLELILTEPTSSSGTGSGDLRRLSEKIEIGDGVSLYPPPVRWAGAIGNLDIASVLLSIPIGIASHLAAIRLHEWMVRHNIRRVRVNGVEVAVSGQAEEVVTAIAQLFESRPQDRQPQVSDGRGESDRQ